MLSEQEIKSMSEQEFLLKYSEIDNKGSNYVFNAIGGLVLAAILLITGIWAGDTLVYIAFGILGVSVFFYKQGMNYKKKAVGLWLMRYPNH